MPIPCNRCHRPLPAWELRKQDAAICPECGTYSIVRVFPAMFYAQTDPVSTEAAAQGEATCFDHPAKRAVAACGHCGRFVCQLCSVEFKGGILCPSCFTAGESVTRKSGFENSRTLYDSVALTVALAPILFWPATILSAPVALYLSFRYWNRPLSLVRRWRWRLVLAMLVSLGEITGWVWLVAYLVLKART
jgi:hypothetical protein